MAYTRTLFLSDYEESSIDIHCNISNRLYIAIKDEDSELQGFITLDLETSKALLKHLRSQVKLMEHGEE